MIYLSNGTLHDFADHTFTPDIKVVASSLAHQNRFNGHVGQYSVAQHSLLCSHVVPEEHALAALLHDAAECYTGDLVAPIKKYCDAFKAIEFTHERRINEYFGVDIHHNEVKIADLRMLITEAKAFGMPLEWFPPAEAYDDIIINRMIPARACHLFLERFKALNGGL